MKIKETGRDVDPADLTTSDGGNVLISSDDTGKSSPSQGHDVPGMVDTSIVDPEPSLGWPFHTLADAYAERSPVTYAVSGILAHGTLNIPYGAPGSLKSFLIADAAVCVAGGIPWLKPLPKLPGHGFPTAQSPVLWIDFDNGIRRTHDRFEALGRARDLPSDAPFFYTSMPQPWLAMSDAAQANQMVELIAHYKARLVVIDNLSLICGAIEENSAEMGKVMGNFRRVAEWSQAALVVIHHQRKGNSGASGRRGDALRGHSSIEASLDVALLIEREEGADSVTIRGTKVRGVDIAPFGAIFAYQPKPGNSGLYKARFFGVKLAERTTQQDLRNVIIEQADESPGINQTSMVKKVHEEVPGFGINRIRAELDRMVSEGLLRQADGSHNAKCFYVA